MARESRDRILALILLAYSIARAVFPDAVEPIIAICFIVGSLSNIVLKSIFKCITEKYKFNTNLTKFP